MSTQSDYSFVPVPDGVDAIRLEPFDPDACSVRIGKDSPHFFNLEDVLVLLDTDRTHPLTRAAFGLHDLHPVLTRTNGPAYLKALVVLIERGWTALDEVAAWDAACDGRWRAAFPKAKTFEHLMAPLRRQVNRFRGHAAVLAELMRARPGLDEASRVLIACWRTHDTHNVVHTLAAQLATYMRANGKFSPLEQWADAFVGAHEQLLVSHQDVLLAREATTDTFMRVLPLVCPHDPLPSREQALKLMDQRFVHAITPRTTGKHYIVHPRPAEQMLHDYVLPRITANERVQLQASLHTPHVVWVFLKHVMQRALPGFREYSPSEMVTALSTHATDYFRFQMEPHQGIRLLPDRMSQLPYKDPVGADIPENQPQAPRPLAAVLDTCLERSALLQMWTEEARGSEDAWLHEVPYEGL